jgi:hypothetical protein
MSEQKMVRLNLIIGGRSFPVKVEKSEVADLKELEKVVNGKINEFMIKYPTYERIDLITMAFLSLVSDLNNQRFQKSEPVLDKRLDDLATLLDTAL